MLKAAKIGLGAAAAMPDCDTRRSFICVICRDYHGVKYSEYKAGNCIYYIKRSCAFAMAMLIAFVCFSIFGYQIWVIGIFCACLPRSVIFLSFQDAIAMDSVLITHFMQNSLDLY